MPLTAITYLEGTVTGTPAKLCERGGCPVVGGTVDGVVKGGSSLLWLSGGAEEELFVLLTELGLAFTLASPF